VTPLSTREIAHNAGLAERTVQRRLQIARNLSPEQREMVRRTPLANEQKELLEISRIKDPERRTGVIRLMTKAKPPQTVNEAIRLYRISKGEITPEYDVIKPSNWWAFGRPKWLQEGFRGSIPGEIYANALYYFAPSKGVAADGMAGSGMLRRIYDDRSLWQHNRKFSLDIQLYDLYPREPFATQYNILPHDMLTPLPNKVDWLFLDPPYYRIAADLYDGELAQTQDYQRYCELITSVIIAAKKSLKRGGIFCLFTTPYVDISNTNNPVIDVPADLLRIGTEQGLRLNFRVYVSRGEQQRRGAGYINIKARSQRRMFSDVCELLVFQAQG